MSQGKSSPPKKIGKADKRQPVKQPGKKPVHTAQRIPDNGFNENRKKQILIYGGVFFLIESILAVIFYRERLFVDASYYIFYPIETGWFKIDHQRFILAFAQILPLIGRYLGFSLKALLILYSLNHVFFFLALFLILVKRKDLNGALAITALLAFNTSNLFVNPFLEIWYGAGFAVLLFSFLQKKTFAWKDYIWIALLEITVLFSHPENYVLIIFLALLDIQKRKKFNRMHIMMLIILLVSARYKYLTIDSYEASKFGGDFHGAHSHHLMDLLRGENLKNLVVFMFRYYWAVLILLLGACIQYAISGKYLRGAIVFFAFVGTVVLLNIVAKNDEYSIYGSTMYMPIISIAVIPFFYDAYAVMKERIKAIVFATFVLTVGLCFYILADSMGIFTQRVDQMENIIGACDKMGGNKFIMSSDNFEKPYSQVSWSFPIETLLLSAERGKNMCRSVIRKDDINDHSKVILTDSNAFMINYTIVINEKELNPNYFHIGGGVYKVLDYKE